MRTLQKYILVGLLVTFLATLVIFTFVLSIGAMFKISDLLARGVPWQPILKILLGVLPAVLSLAIPVSILTSCLLMFGRLSADGEIVAMRACGVSIWEVTRSVRLFALFLVILCIYINNVLMPKWHYIKRDQIIKLGVESPLELLTEGRFIRDFPGLTIYIGRRKNNELFDIRIYDLRGRKTKREVYAKTGFVSPGKNPGDLELDLYEVRVDPFLENRPGSMFTQRWRVTIPDAIKTKQHRRKPIDLFFSELLARVRNVHLYYPHLEGKDLARQKSMLLIELNERLVLAFACYAFVLVGIPLGIKAHRKESSLGVAIALLVMFAFYLFVILAKSLTRRSELHPELIIWLPVVMSALWGSWLFKRQN